MATKNIVPNADGEGQLGTSSKSWAQGHIDSITGTIATAAQGSITSLGNLTTLTVDDITIDGSTISDGGDITIDAAGGIILDADSSGTITIKDNTVTAAFLYHYSTVQSGDFGIFAGAADKDIYLQGSSGGSTVNALHLDMSASGLATFGGNIKIPDSGTIGCASDNDLLTLASGLLTTAGNLQLSDGSPNIFFHTTGNHYNWMIAAQENVSTALEISVDGAVGTGSDTTASNYTPVITALASGNVGIGDTAPDSRLDVVGDMGDSANAVVRLRGTNSTARTTRLQLEDYSGAIADALIDFVIPSAGSSTGSYLGMGVNGSGLKVKVDGNVEIASGSLQISNAGDGINFSATSDASGSSSEVLDDYEEGSWTPTLSTTGGSGVGTASSAGQYTKIGRQVIVHFQFTLSSSSGGSGSLLITNLPFTVAANSGAVTGSGRILDLGQTITVGHYTGTDQISIFKYNGNYAGTDFFTTGFVTYYVT